MSDLITHQVHTKKKHPQEEGSEGTTLIRLFIKESSNGLVAKGNE